jgi:acetyl esterase
MPLDPQVKRFLNAVHLAGLTPWYLLSAREVRDGFETGTSKCLSRPARAVNKEDRLIPSPFCSIPIRIYRPENQEAGPSPALVFYHGGGFVIGSIDTHDTICHEVCSLTGMTVIFGGIRRAPEHKFPAPHARRLYRL